MTGNYAELVLHCVSMNEIKMDKRGDFYCSLYYIEEEGKCAMQVVVVVVVVAGVTFTSIDFLLGSSVRQAHVVLQLVT